METKQHTPGPWAVSRDAVPPGHVQLTVYAEATGERVATVFQAEANAPLIAAAPALVAACRVAHDHFVMTGKDHTRAAQMVRDALDAIDNG